MIRFYVTRIKKNFPPPFTGDKNRREIAARRVTELELGRRMVDALITNTILPEVGQEFLSRSAAGSEIERVHLGVKAGNFTFAFNSGK